MRVNLVFLHRFNVRAPLLAGLACAALTLSGCASWGRDKPAPAAQAGQGTQTVAATQLQKFLWIFTPYRPDIQQGNFISKEMLEQLKVGQTREQVQFILGTSLLTDIFHADRWDYPFRLQRGNGELTTSLVTVYFKGDLLEKIEGGNLPTEREYIDRIAGKTKTAAKEAPKKEDPGSASIKISK
ncbi:MAG: outer membrane protein assembly factor BamE [Pseudomonadota bacterium]